MNLDKYPLVSIIIPYYNHNHFIKRTLDSILEEDYPNKEIIIINDGSINPDDSNITKWIDEHKNIDIKYIKRENKGVTRTLNELIDLAKGKYIMPCASDDYFINNTLKDRVKTLENISYKMLLNDNIVIDDNDKIISKSNLFDFRKGKRFYLKNSFLMKIEIIKRWGFAGPCYIIEKSFYKEIGKYNENLIVEDWDFFLRAISTGQVIFYDKKPASAYRIHENNTFSNENKKNRMFKDLAITAKQNISNFNCLYFKFILWKIYKKYIKNVIEVKCTEIL